MLLEDEIEDTIYKIHGLLANSLIRGKLITPCYYMFYYDYDVNKEFIVPMKNRKSYELNDYYVKIFDFKDGYFLYLKSPINRRHSFIVTTEDDLLNHECRDSKYYDDLSELFVEKERQLIMVLKTLNTQLPDYLQDNDFIKMIKNVRVHFENDIGSLEYNKAKHDFESRCIGDD